MLGTFGAVFARTLTADPTANPGDAAHYLNLLGQLEPGDTLQLPAGTYRQRLNLRGIQGRDDAWITVTGPSSGDPAVITTESTCCNAVELGNTWYVALKRVTIDANSDGVNASIDGIKSDALTHDILIEDCNLVGLSYHQQTVGISTKSVAWNWTIRRNTITEPGTGIYLGSSNGSAPFLAGIIESNLIVDSIGYNMQIKYQNAYSQQPGMPPEPHRTIIRNNVFIKRRAQTEWPPQAGGNSRISGPRPNLLVGGFPDSGFGSTDLYEIYGNFFFMNPDEALFQGSGRLAFHDNILVTSGSTAVRLQHHDLPLKLAHLYNNTIYAGAQGIRFGSLASDDDAIVGNLVFSASPISGQFRVDSYQENIVGPVADAVTYVSNPSLTLGEMDFFPLPGRVQGSPLDLSAFTSQVDYDADFNGVAKGEFRFRGAYAGEGGNPGWQLNEEIKIGGPSSGEDPVSPPPAPTYLRPH